MAFRGSSTWRKETWGEPCNIQTVAMPIYAGGPRFHANIHARDALILLGSIFLKHNYIVRRIGCFNCRKITGGTGWSSHSWGTSVDVNDDTNPYRKDRLVTDMSTDMVAEILSLRTIDGVQIFRWGGNWDSRPETPHSNYDAMHWEIIATLEELKRGFVRQAPATDNPAHYPVIRKGATGSSVKKLQQLLKMQNTTGQGTFGPRTDREVRKYQQSHGLVPDGIVGTATWTALLTDQPVVPIGGITPLKTIHVAREI